MSKSERLRKAGDLKTLAALLGFTPSGLAYVLYKRTPKTLYTSFDVPKRGGGVRKISAPKKELKLLQKRMAELLTLCLRDIEAKHPVRKVVSHGFHKDRSIVTNAVHHRRRRYVLNLDISDFFGAINFGRVRGYFIQDNEFKLNPTVATIIAQIACYENSLPQGSPCSPIISNLIGAILDRRLITLAKRYRCTYTRYADDLTFSTREKNFPRGLAVQRTARRYEWRLGIALKREISAAGFSINQKKTRVQIVGSRQVTTGLVVNEKVNIAQEYYRATRSMCHLLFRSGVYHRPETTDAISELAPLEGRLAHIYYVKARRDRTDKENKELKFTTPRAPELLYKRFLVFKYFIANPLPTIITEGRSDIIYLRSAIKALSAGFPELAATKDGKIRLNVNFVQPTKTNKRLLNLGEGTGGIAQFIRMLKHEIKPYPHAPLSAPVIIFTDNDSGAECVFGAIKAAHKVAIDLKSAAPFHHLDGNIYLVKTPVGSPLRETHASKIYFRQLGSASLSRERRSTRINCTEIIQATARSFSQRKSFAPTYLRLTSLVLDPRCKRLSAL